MAEIIIRQDEGADPPINPYFDTMWVIGEEAISGCGDWVIAEYDPDAEQQDPMIGGFVARDPLATAIILQLFSFKRRPQSIPGSGDRRGWVGDTFDINKTLHERELGSWLHTLTREALTDDVIDRAEYYATECLQVLIDQGAADDVRAEAWMDKERGWLMLLIEVFIKGQELPYQMTVPAFPMR